MENTPRTTSEPPDRSADAGHAERTVNKIEHLGELLDGIHGNSDVATLENLIETQADRLVHARLGMASSLFAALRCKHQPTAAHSLRVALGCSMWATARGMDEQRREQIEIAALLHDIGKVGVPDELLLKPGPLSSSEAVLIDRHRKMGLYVLLSCCESGEIIKIVGNNPAWFDGSKNGFERKGQDLPLGARMLSIVDAFDSMTTDHVYRSAVSRERALGELYQFSGSQFDPQLVTEFGRLQLGDLSELQLATGRRWLDYLDGDQSSGPWQFNAAMPPSGEQNPQSVFQKKLLDNMHDGVVFVDTNYQVLLWNRGAERLTGVSSEGFVHQRWDINIIHLSNENGDPVRADACPVRYAIETGTQSLQRYCISGRSRSDISVNVHAVPVVGPDGTMYGATLLLHDISSQTSLEERCQFLHEKASKDPLTQVANRAEFDRVYSRFVKAHLEQNLPCSLVMADIDLFKSVNDNFGHQAGDEALVGFAKLLKSSCRPGDLVARYGGEEFVILCAGCDIGSATRRAEKLRHELSHLPMTMLDGQHITASFGVTSIQPGDTTVTMLRRADRALLRAKAHGRNRVVQLGDCGAAPRQDQGWFSWWTSRLRPQPQAELLEEQHLLTPVPLRVAVRKLSGFLADRAAKIESIGGNLIVLSCRSDKSEHSKRSADRPMRLLIEMSFAEQLVSRQIEGAAPARTSLRTTVKVGVRPVWGRDRRQDEAGDWARQIIASLRSYLMADPFEPDSEKQSQDQSIESTATEIAPTWLVSCD